MLLESSILLINVFVKNIFLLVALTATLLILNYREEKDFFLKFKKIGKFIFIYLFYCMINMFFYRNGVIILKWGNIYITKEGLNISLLKFFLLNNFFLLSIYMTVKFKAGKYKSKIKHPIFDKIKSQYSDVFRVIFNEIPYILQIIEKKVSFSDIYKKILVKVYRNL